MIDKILHFKEVEAATVKIICGNKKGSAFFIPSDTGEILLLTAAHNLTESATADINVSVLNGEASVERRAIVLKQIAEKDVALLKLAESDDNFKVLPIGPLEIAYNHEWETYGFPVGKIQSGSRFNGKVSRINTGTKWDVDLECYQYNNIQNFEGLSGSPLIIDGMVAGVIGYDLAGTLGASSIASILTVLNDFGIEYYQSPVLNSIPASIEEESSDTTPNQHVLTRINNTILQQRRDKYFLLSGSPGSGKTTLVAQFKPDDPQFVVCDKYFVKVPDKENIPTQVRASLEFFMDWAAGVYSRILFNAPPEKSDKPLNERLVILKTGFRRLSDHYKASGKTGLILIDGLDDVEPQNIDAFLSLLPDKSCSNLKVIISCTSKQILPGSLQAEIREKNEIKVTPLDLQKAELVLSERLKNRNLSHKQIAELATKSEGHPLYLRYLTKYVMAMENIQELNNWIETIPKISGDIEIYYRAVWNKFQEDQNEIWIASTIANLRQPVTSNMLYEMLPEFSKSAFPAAFPKIQHLLRNTDKISIYHTSFSDFIKDQTPLLTRDIHDRIADFCRNNKENSFAVSEHIYHLLQGNEFNKRAAIDSCNQQWIDRCALQSVNPDVALSDIRMTIGMAAEFGLPGQVIRLLLLSQRVNFRYNILFEENATYLVSALLAMGKPAEALRYVVRNGSLTVSDGDGLFLLQRFFECGAKKEAQELYTVIKNISSNLIEEGLTSENFNRFADLRFSSLTLSSNLGIDAVEEYMQFKEHVVNILKKSGNDEATINHFKDQHGSYQYGYMIWRIGLPAITRKDEDQLNLKFDERVSGFLALSINQAKQFRNMSGGKEDRSNISDWVADMEYVIDKYGTSPDYSKTLISVLMAHSQRHDLADALIKQQFTDPVTLSLRDKNGVDCDQKGIQEFSLYAESLGYIDSKNAYPKLLPLRHGQWENSLTKQIEYISFLTGKAYRLKAEGKSSDIPQLKQPLETLLKALNPELTDRQHWERAYALPEAVIPWLYGQVVNLLIDFFPEDIPKFIDPIVKKAAYQLGIYTEGYIDTLFAVAQRLSKIRAHWLSAHKILNILEEHVIATVENRAERNEYLLRLAEMYAFMENEDKAQQAFKLMIEYSMGPSWYKEDQLGIINTAVKFMLPAYNKFTYLQKFAADLHHASGEMTFQRYVKQQQEEFTGDLAKSNALKTAINYFKYLVLPDYATIIKNAESGLSDTPAKGQGYVLGARAIEEQAGVADILDALSGKYSLVAWGLSELQIPGDERYLNTFTDIQSAILNATEQELPDQLPLMLKRLAKFSITEVDQEFRNEYLSKLFSNLTATNKERLNTQLKQSGLKVINPATEKDGFPGDKTKWEDPLDYLEEVKREAIEKLEVGNKSGARKVLIEGLKKVQDKKYSIWPTFFSHKINEVTDLLSQVSDSGSDFIKTIRELLINEPYQQEWIIADRLIKLMGKISEESEKDEIVAAVSEHIQQMVKTPEEVTQQYWWMATGSDQPEEEQGVVLLEFLIWFLNHPSLTIKNRTIEILVWLSEIIPETILTGLVREILSPGYLLSKELSGATLHQIASKDAQKFWLHFKPLLIENEAAILDSKHFMIRNTIVEVLKTVIEKGCVDASLWLEKLESFLTTETTNASSDVYFDEDYLEPVSGLLEELANQGIINGKFAKLLIRNIEELLPLTLKECISADSYIDRSFNDYNDVILTSDFESILRYALNVTVTDFVPKNQRNAVAAILRFYQPTFPENKLSATMIKPGKFDQCIHNIFEKNSDSIDDLYANENIILHYLNNIHDKNQDSDIKYECTAYLIPIHEFNNGNHSYKDIYFLYNNLPDFEPHRNDELAIPLITKSSYVETVGSEIVPSDTLNFADESLSSILSGAQKVYWRNGRSWNQKKRGTPLANGFSVTVSIKSFDSVKERYKLVWVINYKYQYRVIDVFEKKLIHRAW